MPCFARQIRSLNVKIPEKVSLFEDGDRIETEIKKRLKAESHEELHEKLDQMTDEEKKELLEEVLEGLNQKKKTEFPDRMSKIREQAKEVWTVA